MHMMVLAVTAAVVIAGLAWAVVGRCPGPGAGVDETDKVTCNFENGLCYWENWNTTNSDLQWKNDSRNAVTPAYAYIDVSSRNAEDKGRLSSPELPVKTGVQCTLCFTYCFNVNQFGTCRLRLSLREKVGEGEERELFTDKTLHPTSKCPETRTVNRSVNCTTADYRIYFEGKVLQNDFTGCGGSSAIVVDDIEYTVEHQSTSTAAPTPATTPATTTTSTPATTPRTTTTSTPTTTPATTHVVLPTEHATYPNQDSQPGGLGSGTVAAVVVVVVAVVIGVVIVVLVLRRRRGHDGCLKICMQQKNSKSTVGKNGTAAVSNPAFVSDDPHRSDTKQHSRQTNADLDSIQRLRESVELKSSALPNGPATPHHLNERKQNRKETRRGGGLGKETDDGYSEVDTTTDHGYNEPDADHVYSEMDDLKPGQTHTVDGYTLVNKPLKVTPNNNEVPSNGLSIQKAKHLQNPRGGSRGPSLQGSHPQQRGPPALPGDQTRSDTSYDYAHVEPRNLRATKKPGQAKLPPDNTQYSLARVQNPSASEEEATSPYHILEASSDYEAVDDGKRPVAILSDDDGYNHIGGSAKGGRQLKTVVSDDDAYNHIGGPGKDDDDAYNHISGSGNGGKLVTTAACEDDAYNHIHGSSEDKMEGDHYNHLKERDEYHRLNTEQRTRDEQRELAESDYSHISP